MKYIVGNLKGSLNEKNIDKYVDIISKVKYDNLIICPENKYINKFKNIKIGSQDYYEGINTKYVILGHYEKGNTSQEINKKIKESLKNNIKVILCIGDKEIKTQLNEDLKDINDFNNIIVAYEPVSMIGTNNKVELDRVKENILYVKNYFNNNMVVLYGGNVNENNIEEILKISDGVLVGRLCFNPITFKDVINKIIKKL